MISIVMAYCNRKTLLRNTLETIKFSKVKDFEVVIVDDCSEPEEKVNDFIKKWDFNIRVIELERKNKWYYNPCIPYNIGLDNAKGDVLIIQNPECMHLGDVLSYTSKNISKNKYISYACYSLNRELTTAVEYLDYSTKSVFNTILDKINPPVNRGVRDCEEAAWYNHPQYRPLGYHWCCAITRDDLNELGGGFDERFSTGVAYDDDEFVFRVRTRGMNVEIPTSPLVLHQWHGLKNYYSHQGHESQLRQTYNQMMLDEVTRKEKLIKVNNLKKISTTVPFKINE